MLLLMTQKLEGLVKKNIYNQQIINRKLQYASRAYESILFYEFFCNVNFHHTIEIEVTEGNITLAGIIAIQKVKTSVPSATFSPSNPFTASHTLQPIMSMEPTVEPIEIQPTTSDDFDSENNIIEFNKDGYTDGAKQVITISIPDEIILITSKIPTITLKTDGFKQDKDQYLPPKLEHAIITIPSPEYNNNSYEDGELGVHANSNDPIIQISSETVPLKLFNDDIRTVTVPASTQASQSMKLLDDSDMNFRKVELSKGNLSLHFAEEVKGTTFSDGIFFPSSQMKAQCNNTSSPIFITFEDIMLATKSNAASIIYYKTKSNAATRNELNSQSCCQ